MECLNCGSTLNQGKNSTGKYCNNVCQAEHRTELLINAWLSGEIPGWTGKARQLRNFVRHHLHEERGTACEECGWNKKHPVDGAVLTEIDHIDGDAENCSPENLKILCPNCHSMTPTFRRRNKNSKRSRS